MADNVGDDAAKSVARRPRPGLPGLPEPAEATLRPGATLLRAAPALMRVATGAAVQLFSWTLGASVAGANYVAKRAAAGQAPGAILHDAAGDLRSLALRALGLDPGTIPAAGLPGAVPPERIAARESSSRDLQQRGGELLRRSNDVHVVEDTHPAFARILSEITPDEARILRFIYLEGPQPSIDIRTFRPLGIGSELIAGGMNMIGEHAGLRSVERIHPYLTNLARLGLIEFSKEPVSNPTRYQVIEAQPKVVAALKSAGRAPKIVQRSIRLNSFGEEFVRTCLPLNGRVSPSYESRPLPR
jgi:hypothetical protein